MSLAGNPTIFGIRAHESGTTQLHPLGTIGATADGRSYRYAEAGAVELAAGQLCIAVDITANHEDLAVNTAAVGDKTLTITLGATAIAANDYDGGYVNVTDDTGQGVMYLIDSAPATDASGSVIVTLHEPVHTAFAAATTVTLVRNKYKEIIVSDGTITDLPVGVPNVIIAANAFGWVQTSGLCSILVDASDTTPGAEITIGDATSGGVETRATTEVCVGIQPAGSGADVGEYGVFDLTLD